MLRGSSEETLSEHDEELENSSLSEKEKLFSEDSSPARAMNGKFFVKKLCNSFMLLRIE